MMYPRITSSTIQVIQISARCRSARTTMVSAHIPPGRMITGWTNSGPKGAWFSSSKTPSASAMWSSLPGLVLDSISLTFPGLYDWLPPNKNRFSFPESATSRYEARIFERRLLGSLVDRKWDGTSTSRFVLPVFLS